ncbi:dihydroxy-acid dehydratase [Amnibacterium sp. CER49]|uniref:dihydroxy-acid dehydratase n=1 Tax=Amnibacterium sp. CER49 TaxID=3039161 RepID=UPI00244D3D76|nr:dihydroxy-acid dehydratase [Amnibacterium sp. CER49]MDH2443337.1 dihydroxy-acid dehydratase [Amnibacterium sp. CER49]
MAERIAPVSGLRSSRWLDAPDEVGIQNRAALRAVGLAVESGRPVVGISNTISDLNPCNSSMREQIEEARQGVIDAGGVPVVFPTISLGEDLMKPSAMLYRNLLAIEVEEMVRAYPIDALVLTANCDKTIPGAIMGATSSDVPTVLMLGGARPAPLYRGERLASGTDLWRALDDRRTGRMTDEQWESFERCYSCGLGACNVMGTATTMAIVAETLGFTLAGASTIPAGEPLGLRAANAAGRLAVERARNPIRPRELVTEASLQNALKVVAACGGSTNAVVHIAAIAGRAGIRLSQATIAGALSGVPVVADVQPIGRGLAQDFHAAGGVPALVHALGDTLDRSTRTVQGGTLGEAAKDAAPAGAAIRPIADVAGSPDGLAVVRGSLAPDGAVIKVAAASERLLVHRGPAVVFDGYEDMRARVDDPDLEVTPDSVLVIRGAGPVGGPGMPEWGMVPIPKKLAEAGITDMVRVSDARMSGTSFGTVFLHVAPEAAVGGPLALVRTGDVIAVDVPRGRLDLEVEDDELERRRAAWRPAPTPHVRGWVALYQRHVTQAPEGCDLDFLQAFAPGTETFVEPVVGRS